MMDGAPVYCQINVKLERQLSLLKSVTSIIIVMLLQNNSHDCILTSYIVIALWLSTSGRLVDMHLYDQILIGWTISTLPSRQTTPLNKKKWDKKDFFFIDCLLSVLIFFSILNIYYDKYNVKGTVVRFMIIWFDWLYELYTRGLNTLFSQLWTRSI